MSTTDSPMMTAALSLAARGFHVLVLAERSKIPPEGSNGLYDATADPAKLRQFFTATPRANIGINCAASRVVVVDVDHHREVDGEATLAALVSELGTLPETAEALTGGGGRHLVFAAPAGAEFRGKLGPGVDIRYRAYVVVAPSVHPDTGVAYRWVRSPLDQMPSELPAAWLARMIKPTAATAATVPTTPKPSTMGATAYGRKARDEELEKVRTWPHGDRNNQFNRSAIACGSLHAGGELEDCREELIQAAMSNSNGPPITEREARGTVESGWRKGLSEPRTAPPKHDRPMPTTSGPAPVVDLATDEPWPEPEPLPSGLPNVLTFDDRLLPESLRPWVVDIAERVQCPPEFPAAATVVAVGAVIGRSCATRPKQRDDWQIVPNLWGMVIALPAGLKSPATAEAQRPLRRLEVEAADQYARDCQNREARRALSETRKNAIKKRMAAALKAGEDTSLLVDEFTEATEEGETTERRFSINDGTVEKIGELLIENQRGLLVNRDELSGWFATLDRDGHENDRAFYLEAWNGTNSYTVDRIGRGTQHIPALCLSIWGGIQPGPLAQIQGAAMKNGAGNDGLLQRFQVTVYPDSPHGWRNVDRWPDSAARNRAFEVFQRLDRITPASAGATVEEYGLPYLRFDGAAQELFDSWRSDLMTRLRVGGEHAAVESHLVKYSKLMPALALITHLADGGQGAITLASAQRAAAWCDLLESHARRVYASVVTGEVYAADLLLAKLRAGRLPNPFTPHDVYHSAWSGLADRAAVEAALLTLGEYGWVRAATVGTVGRSRREYHAHPLLAVPAVPQLRDSQISNPSRAQRIARDM